MCIENVYQFQVLNPIEYTPVKMYTLEGGIYYHGSRRRR